MGHISTLMFYNKDLPPLRKEKGEKPNSLSCSLI